MKIKKEQVDILREKKKKKKHKQIRLPQLVSLHVH